MIRFEILLPLFHNDGRPIEHENWQAVRAVKETLKTRFEQLEIWITAHRIEVV